MKEEQVTAAAIGISYSVQVDEKRSMVFQTFVPQDTAVSDINKLSDKLEQVAGRQEAKHELVKLHKDLEHHEVTLKRLEEDMVRLDNQFKIETGSQSSRGQAKSKADFAKHEAERSNALVSVKRFKEEIHKIEREIVLQEAKVNGTSSTTNRRSGDTDS